MLVAGSSPDHVLCNILFLLAGFCRLQTPGRPSAPVAEEIASERPMITTASPEAALEPEPDQRDSGEVSNNARSNIQRSETH